MVVRIHEVDKYDRHHDCDNDAADNCGAGDGDGHYCGTAAAGQHTRGVEGPQGGDREVDVVSRYVRSIAAKKKCSTMCHIPYAACPMPNAGARRSPTPTMDINW